MKLILFLKGIVIGIFKVIPGLSGSMIAYNLGIYETCINKINNLFNKENIIYLSNIGIGIIISIIFFSKIISYLYINYLFIFIMISIGLIMGTTKIQINNKRIFFLTLIISFLLLSIKINIHNNIHNGFYCLILGTIEAITSVVPSLSGSAIFMLMGSYEYVLSLYSKISIPFIVGIIIGLVLSVKVINYLLKKHRNIFLSIINGLTVSTILSLFIKNIHNIIEFIIGIIVIIGIKFILNHTIN